MIKNKEFRKNLSMPGLLATTRKSFKRLPDAYHDSQRFVYPLVDHLMAGLAVFLLKYPSLLSFDEDTQDQIIAYNLKQLFGLGYVPSDTQMRERLDEVLPFSLRGPYKKIFSLLQRGKILEEYEYLARSYLLSIDGTGIFSSDTIHCKNCNAKHHKKSGKVSYYHQILNAVIVHPDKHEVIPLAPEAILKTDGQTKNDCERSAAKRLLQHIRREHPHLKLTVTEDGLSSNGPHIRLLKELDMHFILGAKPNDHGFLFNWVENSDEVRTYEKCDKDGTVHRFRYLNHVPLNDANFDLEVNFLDYEEIKPNGKHQHFSWVTDFHLSELTVYLVMRGGRARWKIENETFNTLKNQGYHYEHNYGHGYHYLCTVFAYLMMLAFLIDQTQQLCCRLFQAALEKMQHKSRLWERMSALFFDFFISDWEQFYQAIIHGLKGQWLCFDSS